MSRRRKTIGWGVGLALVAAMITTGTVYAATSATKTGSTLSSEEMRALLIPLDEQPEARFAEGPMNFKEAAANGALATPEGMVFKPESCANYLETVFGPLEQMDGWLQYGGRAHTDHNDNFVQAVVNVPGGADQDLIDQIKEAVSTCRSGTLTLEGTVTGEVTYTEREPLALSDAATYGTTWSTVFSEEPGTEAYDMVLRYQVPPNAQLLVDTEQHCVQEVNFLATGDTLIFVIEADLGVADELTQRMYDRLQGVQA